MITPGPNAAKAPLLEEQAAVEEVQATEDTRVAMNSSQTLNAVPEPQDGPAFSAPVATPTYTLDYDTVYRSIPFRRSEYLADPGYRHEATMEILLGQLRPKVIHDHYETGGPIVEEPLASAPYVPPFVFDRYQGMQPTFAGPVPVTVGPWGPCRLYNPNSIPIIP
ncbi:hypothetical protein V22_07450 [Calycomorphotria hydatis]|uniref:Uncharacterized protein n=1 Tax=Calycomorphotria hydatis TaxID=2528027 RepID=A0A517T564_9PLAN|nr:hypothetical protein V22_07450 [Calycomorphotria hydatis]